MRELRHLHSGTRRLGRAQDIGLSGQRTRVTMSIPISAIICTHNRAEHLTKAIQSLVDQHTPKDQYEIIVVDNCSTDYRYFRW